MQPTHCGELHDPTDAARGDCVAGDSVAAGDTDAVAPDESVRVIEVDTTDRHEGVPYAPLWQDVQSPCTSTAIQLRYASLPDDGLAVLMQSPLPAQFCHTCAMRCVRARLGRVTRVQVAT